MKNHLDSALGGKGHNAFSLAVLNDNEKNFNFYNAFIIIRFLYIENTLIFPFIMYIYYFKL